MSSAVAFAAVAPRADPVPPAVAERSHDGAFDDLVSGADAPPPSDRPAASAQAPAGPPSKVPARKVQSAASEADSGRRAGGAEPAQPAGGQAAVATPPALAIVVPAGPQAPGDPPSGASSGDALVSAVAASVDPALARTASPGALSPLPDPSDQVETVAGGGAEPAPTTLERAPVSVAPPLPAGAPLAAAPPLSAASSAAAPPLSAALPAPPPQVASPVAAPPPPAAAPVAAPPLSAASLLQAAAGGTAPASLQAQAQPSSATAAVPPVAAAAARESAPAAVRGRPAAAALFREIAEASAPPVAAEGELALSLAPAAAQGGGDPSSGDGGGGNGGGADAAGTRADEAPAGGAADPVGDGLFAGLTGATISAPAASAASPPSDGAGTAADLGAQIGQRVAAGDTRFQLRLSPEGLGEVTVNVRIGADRQLSANLSFAQPEAAAAVGAHAGELQKALEQVGFTLGAGGLAIAVHHAQTAAAPPAAVSQGASAFGVGGTAPHSGGGDGASGGARQPRSAAAASRAFAANGDNPAAAGRPAWGSGADARLDIRI